MPEAVAVLSVEEPNVSGDSPEAKRGQTRTKIRELLDLQDTCYRIIQGAIRFYDGEEIIDVPARELASLLTAWVKADQQVMVRRGQPVPKPAAVEPAKRSQTGLTRPAPAWSEPAKPVPDQPPAT